MLRVALAVDRRCTTPEQPLTSLDLRVSSPRIAGEHQEFGAPAAKLAIFVAEVFIPV
jgi:hypothetical protein